MGRINNVRTAELEQLRLQEEYLYDGQGGVLSALATPDRLHVLNLVPERLLSLASRRSELRPELDNLAACLKESLFHSFLHEALPVYQEVRALMSLDGGDVARVHCFRSTCYTSSYKPVEELF